MTGPAMADGGDCDVLVVGGGVAGLAAAVAAARAEARVVLLEKYGFLGGLATAGQVGTICGLYLTGQQHNRRYVSGGFARELAERLAAACGSETVDLPGGLRVLPYDPWAFRCLADQVAGGTPGLSLVLHGALAAVTTEGRRVTAVEALVWDRPVSFRPACVVDCTGEATLVHLAGGRTLEDGQAQAAAVLLALDGAEPDGRAESGRLALLREMLRGVEDGRLPPICRNVSVLPVPERAGRVLLKIELPEPPQSDWNRMTALETSARATSDELLRRLPAACPAFRGARLVSAAVQVGVRSARRAVGREVLADDDVLGHRKRPDGVVCAAWPIEEWVPDGRVRLAALPEGEHYEIPIGCLTAADLDNVYVAGRCLSAASRALASARVIGTALATGFAAGTAAAFQARGRPQALAVEQLQQAQTCRSRP